MLIKTEDLSPKRIINFYLPQAIMAERRALLFFAKNDCEIDYVAEMSAIEGLSHFLITATLISVAYSENADKEDIKALVLAITDDYLQNEMLPDINDNASLTEKCEAIADAFIRPTLNRDKGDMLIENVQESSMEVRFIGHCAGCPYAQNTLQNVIVRTFKHFLPQINEIRLKE